MEAIRVMDVYQSHGMASVSIPENMPLAHVVSRFALDPNLRAVFLIDSDARFTHMLSRFDLLKWAHLRLFKGKGIREMKVADFVRITEAKEVKSLARRDEHSFSIKESDTLRTALNRMIEYQEDIIPVLDEDRRVLGDLRLSEVLLKTLEPFRYREETQEKPYGEDIAIVAPVH